MDEGEGFVELLDGSLGTAAVLTVEFRPAARTAEARAPRKTRVNFMMGSECERSLGE
jgi:hypothetical protein